MATRGGVAVQAIRITTTKAVTAMTIMPKMFTMGPGLRELVEVLVGARGTRKNHIIKAEVDTRAKAGNKATDLDRDLIKRKAKKIIETKTNGKPKESLHRVNSRESATRTSLPEQHPGRVTSSPSDKKTSRRRSLSNWRRSHPTDSLVLKIFSIENK